MYDAGTSIHHDSDAFQAQFTSCRNNKQEYRMKRINKSYLPCADKDAFQLGA